MFMNLYPRILSDTGEEDRVCEPGLDEKVFRGLPDVFRTMQQRIGMSRWFGFLDSAKAFLKVWHARLLVQLYLCLQLGIPLPSGSVDALAKAPSAAGSSGDLPKEPTSKQSEEVRKLRAACKNAMQHLSTVVLADDHMLFVSKLVCFLAEPVRSWHSEQSRGLRSCDECAGWYCSQALGEWFNSVAAIAR